METLVANSHFEAPTFQPDPPFDSDDELWDPHAWEPSAFGLRPNLPFTLDELLHHLETLGIEIELPFDLDKLEAQGLLPRKIPSDPDAASDVVLYANPVTADRKGDEHALLCPPGLFEGIPHVFDGLAVYDGGDLSDDEEADEVEDGDDAVEYWGALDTDEEEEGGDDLDHVVNGSGVWLRRSWTTLASLFRCLPH
ncbi:unnamed protein product [Linum tenue]|uniref:Uncharacterized protein n=1 Tax=Linum tenue TaxID=586396 RepID=A0AAV0QSY0_9ROSI|nr:unnamed protein product [Linum tenue]